jgi:hypothetical protein
MIKLDGDPGMIGRGEMIAHSITIALGIPWDGLGLKPQIGG